ncbi:hypothetical protein [Enterovirga rhinocerotis]|uniref:Uncharacterized protein n=1 Tax=Enterovirga rhinocerotis TaxID=1339210 RepID=A0A4R7BX06_9HYPH|nr:hypothetical protein [Enterovirga rhinocerotis]TDR90478.1 hypothetical protein EV668_3329 [Enterovirga rhinocerotis]
MAGARSNSPAVERDSLADELQHAVGGEADAARLAAGQPIEDGTEAVEAEVPADNIAHISDASLPSREELAAAFERKAKAAGGKRG